MILGKDRPKEKQKKRTGITSGEPCPNLFKRTGKASGTQCKVDNLGATGFARADAVIWVPNRPLPPREYAPFCSSHSPLK